MLENFDHIRTISISPEREREREETTEALNLELLGQRVVGSTSVSGFIIGGDFAFSVGCYWIKYPFFFDCGAVDRIRIELRVVP